MNHDAPRLFGSILTLCIGVAGGFAAWWLNTPIPWLLGSLCATVLAARLGITLVPISKRSSRWLRVVIGVSLGSFVATSLARFTPHHALAVVLALLFTVLITVLGTAFFRRWLRLDREESFISSLPGGLSYLMAIASDLGDRFGRISLIHTTRIVVLVFTFSALAYFLDAASSNKGLSHALHLDFHPERLLMLGIVIATGLVADRSKWLNGGHVIFGIVFSAIAYQLGWLTLPVPELLITLAMVVLGSLLGVEIAGDRNTRYGQVMLAATIFTLLAMGVATMIALPASQLTSTPFLILLLALAPGGIAEISLIALALGLDVGLVAMTHASRFFMILILGPLGLRYATRNQ